MDVSRDLIKKIKLGMDEWMNNTGSENTLVRFTIICSVITICISLFAIAGWLFDWLIIARISSKYIPMAPSSAVSFIALSAVLLVYSYQLVSFTAKKFAGVTAAFIFVICLIIFIEFLAGSGFDIEWILLPDPGKFGNVTIGRMSPITAVSFMLSSLALLLLLFYSKEKQSGKNVAAYLAAIVLLAGFVILLGYLYGVPRFYGGTIVPVALTTGIAFVFFSFGILSATGLDYLPFRLFTGNSVQARLMRAFLPAIIVLIVIGGWLDIVINQQAKASSLEITSILVVLSVVIVGGIISKISQILGNDIDLADVKRKRAEDALRESEGLLRTVLNNAPITIFAIDNQGVFTLSEGKSLEKVNLKSGENVGVSALDLFATISVTQPNGGILNGREVIRRVLAGESLTGITELRGVNFANQFVPYYDAQGRIIGMVGVATIITERLRAEKALRESEESYRTLIENINLGVCLIDKEHKFITINSAFRKMFGITEKTSKGKYCFEICSKAGSVCPDCPGTKSMALKKTVKMEKEYILANGTYLPVIVHAYPVFDSDNNVKAFIKIMEDISDCKKIEQAKKNMIRDISHSLKTPIAMTEMAFDIAKNSINTGDKESLIKANSIASENLKRLRKDINNILQEFSIDVHKDVIAKDKNAPLNAAIEKITNGLKSFIEEKGLQLDINLLLNADNVKIDARDLETILNNLLENAIKFTDKGKISITGKSKEKMVEIEVKDTGCGISAGDIKMVFEKFYKRNAAIEGTGLGLSICKELVEMYGGEINIYSEGVGKGATVIAKLPAV